jgi:hypothetical protein
LRNTGESLQRVAVGEEDVRSVVHRDGYETFFHDISLSP